MQMIRSNRCLFNGGEITSAHKQINPETGQQKDYVILTKDERSKGFVRPLRSYYVHSKCGALTQMNNAIAETYAKQPDFYNVTFCIRCKSHFPLNEFVWDGTDEIVGS